VIVGTHVDSQCLSCGRDTSAGTSLFASRKRAIDRQRYVEGFLCYPCQDGIAVVTPDQTIPVSGRYVVMDFPGGGIPGTS
jgi:hypothetical protein